FDPDHSSRAELASNPLLLTVMACVFQTEESLPSRRPELYQVTVDYLINIWSELSAAVAGSLTREEAWTILENLAGEIQGLHGTNLLEEKEARRHVLNALQETRNNAEERRDLCEMFFSSARIGGGVFIEVSKKQWRFVHANIQEYLAARSLIRHPDRLIAKVLPLVENPRWREPLLLTLGIASDHPEIPHELFRELLEALLSLRDNRNSTLPRGALLLVDALSDMSPMSDWLGTQLADALLECYADRQGIGRFVPLQERLESSFGKLRSGWTSIRGNRRMPRLDDFLADKLKHPKTAGCVARLMRVHSWQSALLVREIYEARHFDTPDEDFVIDRTLQTLAQATVPDPTKTETEDEPTPEPSTTEIELSPQLEMRGWLLSRSQEELSEFFTNHPEWLRLIGALFGGWGDWEMPRVLTDYST
ncbi:MAG: hypothetical protein KDA84_08755, partial [Planctomycetaceae bacterium]|nr:hypothetical protein [Planctomycetaceae bacterium]